LLNDDHVSLRHSNRRRSSQHAKRISSGCGAKNWEIILSGDVITHEVDPQGVHTILAEVFDPPDNVLRRAAETRIRNVSDPKDVTH
jgi:hypothetical protein